MNNISVKNRTSNNLVTIQATASMYLSSRYLVPERLTSIYYQLLLCEESEGRSFLEIGTGNKILFHLLKQAGKTIYAADIDLDIRPDVIADLAHLPFAARTFDVVMCFQVLEHMPFIHLRRNLESLGIIAKKQVIISLPDACVPLHKLRGKKRFKGIIYQLFHFPRTWNYSLKRMSSEHFWEIGYDNVFPEDVSNIGRVAGLQLVKHFRNPYLISHHFFVFDVRY
ncbi:MAG: class I SAM-dependent methyltransferase [Anaerolineae bacterium]|nr:class I SAM-dependent methyltransferase [Anaerolineae bacterium]